MPKYHVHVYPIVRVLVEDVEADSPEEACEKAEAKYNWDIVVHKPPFDSSGLRVEFADDMDGFLVDFENDPDHELTTRYDHKYRPI